MVPLTTVPVLRSPWDFRWSFMSISLLMASETAGLYWKTELLSHGGLSPLGVAANIESNPSRAKLISFLLFEQPAVRIRSQAGFGT